MRNTFKKLLESIQAQHPDVITEDVLNGFMSEFDDGLAKVTADASAEGQALGFKEGYEEGKKVAADQAKAEFDALVEKLDEESVTKLNEILAMIDENHTAKLQELYDYIKANMVPRTEIDNALAAQDADYATKLETCTNAICEDHAKKLGLFKEAIEKKHAKEIQVIKESIDKEHSKLLTEAVNAVKAKCAKDSAAALTKEQNRKLDILAEGVEKYLNYALEQFKPKKEIISEAKYKSAIKTLDKVTDLLKVNHIIQESKDGIFNEYESKLEAAKATENKLINETIELKAQLDKKEAQLVLESKLQKCTPSEGRFLRSYFKDAASPKVIEESIDAAHAAWKKLQAEHRQVLQESITKNVSKKPSLVVTEAEEKPAKESSKKVISESKAVAEQPTSLVDFYASVLKSKTK